MEEKNNAMYWLKIISIGFVLCSIISICGFAVTVLIDLEKISLNPINNVVVGKCEISLDQDGKPTTVTGDCTYEEFKPDVYDIITDLYSAGSYGTIDCTPDDSWPYCQVRPIHLEEYP